MNFVSAARDSVVDALERVLLLLQRCMPIGSLSAE